MFALCHVYSTGNLETAPQRRLQAGRALPLPLPAMYIHSSDARAEVTSKSNQENEHPSQVCSGFPQHAQGHSTGILHLQLAGQNPASGHLSPLVSFIGLLVAFVV